MNEIKRCKWCNLKNHLYIEYHDNEWGVLRLDDKYLFEMLILEMFQAGLTWECILNKRENFRECFDNFDVSKVMKYNDEKILELLNNPNIIRNKLKIRAAVNNAIIFQQITKEFGTFRNYLKTFTNERVILENNKTYSNLSTQISDNLKQRGMKFVGTTIIYSYLQAIGIINSHEDNCFLHQNKM